MENKANDTRNDSKSKRRKKEVWKAEMESRSDVPSGIIKNMIGKLQKETERLKKELSRKNAKSTEFKIKKWRENDATNQVNDDMSKLRLKYDGIGRFVRSKIFSGMFKQ